MRRKEELNCPNCGAPIRDVECPYCGTIFFDFADMEEGKPCYLRVKINGNVCVFHAILSEFALHMTNDSTTCYYDDKPEVIISEQNYTINMGLDVFPVDSVLFKKYIKPKEDSKHGNNFSR